MQVPAVLLLQNRRIQVARGSTPSRCYNPPMRHRIFGRTGLIISEVGFGAWAIGGDRSSNSYGPTDDEESIRAIRKAIELGCNFFDTADVYGYGHSEELIGRAIPDPDMKNIATKVGGNFYSKETVQDFSPGYIEFACDQSLKRLRVEGITLYQLHNPPLELIKQGEIYDTLERLKEKGKICFIGTSVFTPAEALAVIADGRSDAIQLVYNIYYKEMENEVLPAAKAHNIAIIAREPLGNGFLSAKYSADHAFPESDIRSRFHREMIKARAEAAEWLSGIVGERMTPAQVALRFVLEQAAVSVVIPGIKTEAQAEENLSATEVSHLYQEELENLRLLGT